jgi:hypothetical protein
MRRALPISASSPRPWCWTNISDGQRAAPGNQGLRWCRGSEHYAAGPISRASGRQRARARCDLRVQRSGRAPSIEARRMARGLRAKAKSRRFEDCAGRFVMGAGNQARNVLLRIAQVRRSPWIVRSANAVMFPAGSLSRETRPLARPCGTARV